MRRNKSGIKGVSWDSQAKRWVAFICINYKNKRLGRFKSKLKAKEAYENAARENFGEFYFDGKERTVVKNEI